MGIAIVVALCASHSDLMTSVGDFFSYKIALTSCWLGFTIVNAYYGGALTMFFASDGKLGFETMRDVLNALPEWSIKYLDGNAFTFQIHVAAATNNEKTAEEIFGIDDLGTYRVAVYVS